MKERFLDWTTTLLDMLFNKHLELGKALELPPYIYCSLTNTATERGSLIQDQQWCLTT